MIPWRKLGIHGPRHHSVIWADQGWGTTVQATTTRHSRSVDVLLCVGRNGCGQRKFVAFGAEIREIMIRVLMFLSSVPLEGLRRERQPRTRLSGPLVARTRFRPTHASCSR